MHCIRQYIMFCYMTIYDSSNMFYCTKEQALRYGVLNKSHTELHKGMWYSSTLQSRGLLLLRASLASAVRDLFMLIFAVDCPDHQTLNRLGFRV